MLLALAVVALCALRAFHLEADTPRQLTSGSVGLFVDEAGMDYYTVSDGHGVSLNNSVAIFIDGHGDDIYATARGGRGVARYGRGFSGAAFFADLEGRDTYPAGQDAENGAVWSTTNYSIGVDLDRDVEFPGEEVPEIELTAADSVRAIA